MCVHVCLCVHACVICRLYVFVLSVFYVCFCVYVCVDVCVIKRIHYISLYVLWYICIPSLIIILGDNGSLYFWDWKTGYNFQKLQTTVQPGSLDSEAGIFMTTFDQSGCRLLTAEADKTIKIYKEDDTAVNSGGGAGQLIGDWLRMVILLSLFIPSCLSIS